MKTTLLLVLPALFAGALLGAVWRSNRTAETMEPEAQEEARSAGVAEVNPEVRAGATPNSEASPSSAPGTPSVTSVEDLRSRFASLLAAKDGEGIRALVRDLRDRGEEAFPLLAEVLQALLKAEDPKAMGLDFREMNRLMASRRMRPFAAWGVSRMELIPELRDLMFESVLLACDPEDQNRLTLGFLEKETDDQLCMSLAWSLSAPSEDEVKKIIDAFHLHSRQQDVAIGLIRALSTSPTPDSLRFLEAQTNSADPKIAEQAFVALRTARPPVAGVLVTNVIEGVTGTFRPGDILMSCNGAPVATTEQWWKLCNEMRDSGGKAVLEVERNGVIETVTVEAPPKGLITRAVKPSGGAR